MAGYVATGYWVAGYGDLASSSAAAGGGYDKPKRKKFFIERDGQLLQFGSRRAAMNALQDDDKPIEEIEVAEAPAPPVVPQPSRAAAPEQVIGLPALQAFAQASGQLAAYQAAYRSRHFAALLALFQRQQDELVRQQDEDDVELLLLSL